LLFKPVAGVMDELFSVLVFCGVDLTGWMLPTEPPPLATGVRTNKLQDENIVPAAKPSINTNFFICLDI